MKTVNSHRRIFTLLLFGLILTVMKPVWAADPYMTIAIEPSMLRDYHQFLIGTESVPGGSDNLGLSNSYIFFGSDIWSNENNQFFGGFYYDTWEFDQTITLPNSFSFPDKYENLSLFIEYKHITSKDWSIYQTIHYNQGKSGNPSLDLLDTFDLIGVLAMTPKPTIIFAFGYMYSQTNTTKDVLLPVLEYVNQSHERWTLFVGIPIIQGAYAFHPDLTASLGGSIAVSYKVTESNQFQLSYTPSAWAYRLENQSLDDITYVAQRIGLK